jgi:hypothetical protein
MLGGATSNWGVLGGYWRRVTAIGCCRPGIAGIVIVMPDPVLALYCAG